MLFLKGHCLRDLQTKTRAHYGDDSNPGINFELHCLMPQFLNCLILILLLSFGALSAKAQEFYYLDGDAESMLARASSVLDGQPVKSLWVVTYKLKADSAGLSLLAALVHTAQNGGEALLLVDNKIVDAEPGLIAFAQSQGVKIKFYRPGKVGLKDLLHPIDTFNRLNSRMHSKLFIVNGEMAFIGDKNYTMKSFRTMLGLSPKTVTMLGKEILVTGEPVSSMSEYYSKLWNHPDSSDPKDKLPTLEKQTQIQQSFETHLNWLREQIQKRGSPWKKQTFKFKSFQWLTNTNDKTTMAQVLEILEKVPRGTRILFESPYFILYPELYDLLKTLRARGVPVTVVVNSPDVADIPLIGDAFKIDLPKLLELGIEVELIDFKRRVTHGKVILIGDRYVIIGSGNMDGRSFNINEESNAHIESPEFSSYLWKQYESTKHLRSRAYISESASVSCEKSVGRRIYLPIQISKTKKLFIESIRPQL